MVCAPLLNSGKNVPISVGGVSVPVEFTLAGAAFVHPSFPVAVAVLVPMTLTVQVELVPVPLAQPDQLMDTGSPSGSVHDALTATPHVNGEVPDG